MKYTLVYVKQGTTVRENYISFEHATNKLMKVGSGKLYYGYTLVGEL